MEHISIPDNTILEKSYEMSESAIETVLEVVILKCGHVLSLESLNEWIKIQKICPLCRQRI